MNHFSRRQLLGIAAAAAAGSPSLVAAPAHTLSKLPYAYDALEPYIDARTMEIHHTKHHQAYVDNLNKAVGGDSRWSSMPVEELLKVINQVPEAVRTAVRNHGGGHANHTTFWQNLAPASQSGKPSGKFADAFAAAFSSVEKFDEKMRGLGATLFGSGWVWLSIGAKGELLLEQYPNQDSPLMTGKRPLLGVDVWEHAYYLKYQNRRPEYLAAIGKVLNWEYVSQRYDKLRG